MPFIKLSKLRWVGIFVVIAIFLSFDFALAAKKITDAPGQLSNVVAPTGIVQDKSIVEFVGEIIQWALGAVGLAFFILMVYAGFKWLLARGNDEEINKARDTIIAAGIGLAIIVSAYAITNFVTTRVIQGDSGPGSSQETGLAESNLGCCFDKVRHPGDPLELRATTWQWRVTSQKDCQVQGETTNSFDEIAGSGSDYWVFKEVDTKFECEQAYNEFCLSNDCHDLGFE